jgi:predicted dehydrogenase
MIPPLRESAGNRLVAAASRDGARAAAYAREWGIGRALWDVGCYPLSLARFVLGAEPLEVTGSQVLGPTGVDETFAGQLVFPGGVLAQIDAGFRSALRTEAEFVGTTGTIVVPQPWRPEGTPIRLVHGDEAEDIVVAGPDRYLLEIEDLAACARTGRPPRVSLAESRGNVATIVALLESARTGRPVIPRDSI